MRTIKFRGKTTANGHWVYGSLIVYGDDLCAIKSRKSEPWVIPDTVGQFTGLTDCNGKEIYEGDILQWMENGFKSNPIEIVVKYGAFGYMHYGFHSLVVNTNFRFYLDGTDHRFEIIGNIHDNPELLTSNTK